VGTNPLEECPLDRKSGLIFVMDNTLQGMACLGSQIEFSGMLGRGIERNANFVDQDFLHEARASRLSSDAAAGELSPAPAERMSATNCSGDSPFAR